ncbi:MAG: hypothetical protein HC866_10205 [Leptolyngbyaceae cyanobacterium RU_5_1]|nr:hypothetical protein [Leptolyngbyaceae cyanobacterium RU_5_1]
MATVRNSITILAGTIAGFISLGHSLAFATPVQNQNGDYVGSTAIGYTRWEVVDPDPKGLNCRMAKAFQPATLDSIDTPRELYQDHQQPIASWNVVFSFSPGERLNAVIGNGRFNQIMLLDAQGKPWLGVRTWKGDCFVRANSRFVRPLGQPGWQNHAGF